MKGIKKMKTILLCIILFFSLNAFSDTKISWFKENLITDFMYPSTIQKIPNKSFKKDEKLSINEYQNATILPLRWYGWSNQKNSGGVLSSDNNFIAESSQTGRFDHGYTPDKVQNSNETVFYFGFFMHQWGHFIIECITRLWPIAQNPEKYKNIKIIYLSDKKDKIDGNYLELLKTLGIKESQLLQITTPTRFKKVIIPDKSNGIYGWYTQEYADLIEMIMQNALQIKVTVPKYNKIFLSLKNYQKNNKIKRDIGLDEIEDIFVKNGYKSISPEEFSFVEQVHIINNAKEIITPQGTISHNVIFLNPKPKREILILNRHRDLDDVQLMISELKNLKNVIFIDVYGISGPVNTNGPFLYIPNNLLYHWTQQHHFQYYPKVNKTKIYTEYINAYWNTYKLVDRDRMVYGRLTPEEYNNVLNNAYWLGDDEIK